MHGISLTWRLSFGNDVGNVSWDMNISAVSAGEMGIVVTGLLPD